MSTETQTIEIVVNGKHTGVPRGETVLGLLGILAIPPDRVAVEVDRRIIKQAEWPATVLNPGAEVEIVHFVGGG